MIGDATDLKRAVARFLHAVQARGMCSLSRTWTCLDPFYLPPAPCGGARLANCGFAMMLGCSAPLRIGPGGLNIHQTFATPICVLPRAEPSPSGRAAVFGCLRSRGAADSLTRGVAKPARDLHGRRHLIAMMLSADRNAIRLGLEKPRGGVQQYARSGPWPDARPAQSRHTPHRDRAGRT